MKMRLSRMGRSLKALAAMLLCIASSQTLAAGFSFTGSFLSDDAVFSMPFGLISSQSVTLRTWSYAGGTNAAGTAIPAGGFDPIVSVFNSAGHIVGISDDGIGVATDPVSGAAHDSLLALVLGAGNYLAVLTQFDNFPNGDLADGFSEAGQGNFTAAFGCGASRQLCSRHSGRQRGTGTRHARAATCRPRRTRHHPAALCILIEPAEEFFAAAHIRSRDRYRMKTVRAFIASLPGLRTL
jgi:hypothetical protein